MAGIRGPVYPREWTGKGKYSKLWRRFYEPLVLLRILGTTRGPHSSPPERTPLHRFLDNVAYICDHDKGGLTTSAVAIEEKPEEFVFWVASNNPSRCQRAADFLASTLLKSVRGIVRSSGELQDGLIEELARDCAEFAKTRVRKEAGLLNKDVNNLMKFPRIEQDLELRQWLLSFQGEEGYTLCSRAYQERDSANIRLLAGLRRGLPANSEECVANKNFLHRIGRLSHHIKAPRQIVEDVVGSHQLQNVLDSFVVQAIPQQNVVRAPDAEPDLCMNAIMNRMLPKGEMSKPEYRKASSYMEDKYNIVEMFKVQYSDKNFKPVIHAEVQVLEHFWVGTDTDNGPGKKKKITKARTRRRFLGDERLIGCSKPACYCCHLYFQHHPAMCLVPQTSMKVYPNWGLGDVSMTNGLPDGEDGYIHQRDMLNKIVKHVREEVMDQILRMTKAPGWHADSVTDITWLAEENAKAKASASLAVKATMNVHVSQPAVYGESQEIHCDGIEDVKGEDGDGTISMSMSMSMPMVMPMPMPMPMPDVVEGLEQVPTDNDGKDESHDDSDDDESDAGGGVRL